MYNVYHLARGMSVVNDGIARSKFYRAPGWICNKQGTCNECQTKGAALRLVSKGRYGSQVNCVIQFLQRVRIARNAERCTS